MTQQQHTQFTVYVDKAAVPRYQRAWVWGVAALAILACGLVAGWLFGGGGRVVSRDPGVAISSTDEQALLIRQEAVNEQLRERIARLERALASDACGPAALEALLQDTGKH